MSAGNQQLERYELVSRIAVGGMAEVFLAKAYGAHGFEKTLAIKRILPELASDPEFEERFIAEAKLAVKLSHANVVQVFDFGRVGTTLFLVLEYVDGLDLAALLSRYRAAGRRVPLQAAFHIAIELARGLDYAHQRGVIHRDVSPSNILLSRSGDVKIADFGIAVPDASQYRQSSRQRRIMGKWRYMSPEQTRGEDLGTRSDLFSTAAVMFELFTGDKLFPGEDPEQVIAAIHEMAIPSAVERRADLPPRLDEVLRRALARDPSARPARAAELQRALTEISYEHGIMCTAMAVEAALDAMLAPAERAAGERVASPAVAIDGLIRQQMGFGGEERHTAQHTQPGGPGFTPSTVVASAPDQRPATIIKTGVVNDGLQVWDFGDAVPEGAASERALTEPVRLFDPRRRALSMAVAVAVAIAAGTAVLWRALEPGPVAASALIDAGLVGPSRIAPAGPGFLVVTSTPPGAEVWIDGASQESRAPSVYPIAAGQAHRVEVRLEDHLPFASDAVTVAAQETATLKVQLEPLRVALIVETEPDGALVQLMDRTLGTTPLSTEIALGELARLGPDAPLTLTKAGHRAESVESIERLDLALNARPGEAPDEPLVVSRKLQPLPRPAPGKAEGKVRIHLDQTWANVYLRDKLVGRVPDELMLPVGQHQLKLHNPVSQRTWHLPVSVDKDKPSYYRVPD
ncbi:MAG TPA: serine/threonine-protein kinase [Haliangium sp.]|nr:serine/threonine-protein kinase [Haliangium sp.]